jgi:penicillin-binding protein 2
LGETLVAGIGQGYITTTPLQLATMTARLASGRAVVPTLTRRTGAPGSSVLIGAAAAETETALEAPLFPSLNLSPAWLNVVRGGMNGVSNVPGGTAYNARIKEPQFALAGKTGTAQVKRITMAERAAGVIKTEQRPWKDRDHALFVAFAPVDSPRYAISVVVEHGGGGSAVAAPIARDIMLECQRRDPTRRAPARVAEAAPANVQRDPRDGGGG